jgi:hypothetical protein
MWMLFAHKILVLVAPTVTHMATNKINYMNPTFSLPQQSIPLNRLKVPASAMQRFMKKNNVQLNPNAKLNATTAAVFSDMFDNVENQQSTSTIDTRLEQSEPFTIPRR